MQMLMQSRLWVVLAILAGLTQSARASDVDKLLPNQTELIVVVNVKQIVEAPLIKKHALERLRTLLKGNNEATKILESVGFDPFRDLTSITTATSGVSPDAKFLAIVHGQFDPAKLEKKAEEVAKEKTDMLKISKEGDQKIYEVKANPNDDKPAFVGIVDSKTVVASNDKEYVADAFAKAAGKKTTSLNKDVQTLIEKADPNQSIWLAAPGTTFSKSELASEQKAKQSLEKVRSVTAAIAISKDVKFTLTVAAKTADNAKELAEEIKEGLTQIKGLLAVLAGNQKEIAPVVDLVGSIEVATDGTAVTLKSAVSEDLIEKGLKRD
jgi:hypothetical protein